MPAAKESARTPLGPIITKCGKVEKKSYLPYPTIVNTLLLVQLRDQLARVDDREFLLIRLAVFVEVVLNVKNPFLEISICSNII